MSHVPKTVLVIEDSDPKFEDIRKCILDASDASVIHRASTMVEAEQRILNDVWDLVVLDISMDIAPSRYGAKGRGQANVGGLEVAQKMYLLEREAPTIIVTAFDSFTAANPGHGGSEVLGFEEVYDRARLYLPTALVACLQYNAQNWKVEMIEAVKKVLDL